MLSVDQSRLVHASVFYVVMGYLWLNPGPLNLMRSIIWTNRNLLVSMVPIGCLKHLAAILRTMGASTRGRTCAVHDVSERRVHR